MTKLGELKKHLRPGQVYRRADLVRHTNAVDRHLRELVADKTLQKIRNGVYYYPKRASFGDIPPDDEKLVRAFLKDDNFYIASLNAYNSLGVGTTQLYNERLVYNHKRDGRFELGGRLFFFLKRTRFPVTSSTEFLLVDLMNNFEFLAEDQDKLRQNVINRALGMDREKLTKAMRDYAGARTKKFFESVLNNV